MADWTDRSARLDVQGGYGCRDQALTQLNPLDVDGSDGP